MGEELPAKVMIVATPMSLHMQLGLDWKDERWTANGRSYGTTKTLPLMAVAEAAVPARWTNGVNCYFCACQRKKLEAAHAYGSLVAVVRETEIVADYLTHLERGTTVKSVTPRGCVRRVPRW